MKKGLKTNKMNPQFTPDLDVTEFGKKNDAFASFKTSHIKRASTKHIKLYALCMHVSIDFRAYGINGRFQH